jgi:hypothetical protein
MKQKPGFVFSEDLTKLKEAGHVGGPEPSAAQAFQQTFEQMGGGARMLLWADRFPAQFYKLYARMVIPTIAPVLPSPQKPTEQEWPAWLTARRLSYQEAGFRPAQADVDEMDDPQ